jgi:riboflavin synthase alpha subunit
MFTGLVQDVGRVDAVESGGEGACIRIATELGSKISPGDSVAVTGSRPRR